MSIMIPWEFAFPNDRNLFLNYIILVFFLVDIVFNLRTAYYDERKSEIISSRKMALHYMFSIRWIFLFFFKLPPSIKTKISYLYFVIDVVSVIPFELFADANNFQILQLLKIIRLCRIGKIMKNFSFFEHLRYSTEIIKNLILFLLIIHWFTCLYLGFARS